MDISPDKVMKERKCGGAREDQMRTTGEGDGEKRSAGAKGCSGMRYSTFSRATSVGVIGSGIEGCDSCNLFPPPRHTDRQT
ncbi:hypothetical protein CDAR_4871 [Caerostris darwini]|uniref:Uncharacterized protein n=1 Tax=Caerostris darwini TaxID=1538125 RepID=A0AAV4P3B4_9ARAC|nr:hypothetical protein CDAR_4871 [Caerostris darwini]